MIYPLQNISAVISKVLFPAFSLIQGDNEKFRDAYLKSTRYIAFITFPMMFGLFAVADEFILTIFGPKWEPTIFLFKVLCFVGMLQSINTTVGQIYLAKGKTDWMFKWSIFATSVTLIAICIGMVWSVEGVVIAYLIRSLILLYPAYSIPFRLIELKIKTHIRNLKKEFVTSFIMFAVVLTSVNIQHHFLSSINIILASNVLLGVVIYVAASFIANNEVFKDIQGILIGKRARIS